MQNAGGITGLNWQINSHFRALINGGNVRGKYEFIMFLVWSWRVPDSKGDTLPY